MIIADRPSLHRTTRLTIVHRCQLFAVSNISNA